MADCTILLFSAIFPPYGMFFKARVDSSLPVHFFVCHIDPESHPWLD